jgi:hypothetical protein
MSVVKGFLALIPFMVSSAQASEKDIFLVGSTNGQTPRQETVFFLNKDARLVLSVVLTENEGPYSSFDSHIANSGGHSAANRLRPHLDIAWYQFRPKLKEYSNLWKQGYPDIGDIHLEPIEYEKIPIAGSRGQASIDFSAVAPSGEAGTFYLGVEVGVVQETLPSQFQGLAESSPLHLKYRYRVIQVVRREDDSYLGYLTELFGTPFIIGPRMTDQGIHETDARMGSDCAAFAIYGKRRQGYRVPYCGPLGIYRYLSAIESAPLRPIPLEQTEVYITPDNRQIRTGHGGLRPGDIVHFGEQVSVFYSDAGIKGVFDKDDLLLQCYGSRPTITTLKDSGFYHLPLHIYRWRDDLSKVTK